MFARSSCVAAILLASVAGAAAQTLILEPQQQTIVREYIIAHPVEPVAPPPDFDIVVGAALPEVVEIQPLDVPDLGTTYSYVVIDNRTLLVDPGTRKIVQVIEPM